MADESEHPERPEPHFGERIREALRDDPGPMNGAWWRPHLRRIANEIDQDVAELLEKIT